MTVLELKKILNTLPEDSILSVNNDGFSLFVTTDYNKQKEKVIYHGLFIGVKGSPLIGTEINRII